MTELTEIVDARGPGQPCEFVCGASVDSDVMVASGLAEDEVLFFAARAVEMGLGMAEIHAGTAAGVDRAVFPLAGGALAMVRIHRGPSPRVVVELT